LVQAHIARIEAVDPQINAVVIRRFDEALREAGHSASYDSSESSVRHPVQHCGMAGPVPSRTEVVPGFALRATTRSAKGDGPKTPECLGCRPAGTSLWSLGRTTACRSAEAGHDPIKVCPAGVNRACWVSWCTPTGKLSIRIAVSTVTGRSELYPDLLQLELDTCDTLINMLAPVSLSRRESRKDLWALLLLTYCFIICC
jgi:hypothetical protein